MLARTHDIERGEANKENFIRFIEKHVNFVSAVLLVDHVSQKFTFGTDYVCSILSAIFPKTLVNNIAFVFFAKYHSTLTAGLTQKQVPGVLQSAPVFFLDNPIAQQRRFRDPKMMQVVKDREQRALKMLVEVFNWMDGLEPRPVTEITSLYEVYQNIEVKTTSILYQRAREVEIDRLAIALKGYSAVSLSLCSHLAL